MYYLQYKNAVNSMGISGSIGMELQRQSCYLFASNTKEYLHYRYVVFFSHGTLY